MFLKNTNMLKLLQKMIFPIGIGLLAITPLISSDSSEDSINPNDQPKIQATKTPIPVVPIQLSILSENPTVTQFLSQQTADWIINTLNEHFISLQGEKMAEFKLLRIVPLETMKNSSCGLLEVEDEKERFKKFEKCKDKNVRPKDALHIILYDSGNQPPKSFGYYSFWNEGKRNVYFGRILLHHSVLKARNRTALMHEVGHAFGLGHVPPEKQGSPFKDNFMKGPQGKPLPDETRGFYLTERQAEVVSKNIGYAVKTFGFEKDKKSE